MTGKLWIADKPEMSFEAGLDEGLTQTANAAGNAAGPGIPVRAFKAEYVKLRIGPGTFNCGSIVHRHPHKSLMVPIVPVVSSRFKS
jgi:hypothetical protein